MEMSPLQLSRYTPSPLLPQLLPGSLLLLVRISRAGVTFWVSLQNRFERKRLLLGQKGSGDGRIELAVIGGVWKRQVSL